MTVLFFIYGLAFFALGIAVAIYPKKQSNFWLARNAWQIAAFGILHGLNEWAGMVISSQKTSASFSLLLTKSVLLPLSFFFLLRFGIEGIASLKARYRPLRFLLLVPVGVFSFAVLVSRNPFLSIEIWSRYLLAFPAGVLTALTLLFQDREKMNSGLSKPFRFLTISAIGFLFYAFFAGLVTTPASNIFPAKLLNYVTFDHITGIHVQAFRTLCAIIIAYGMTRVLKIFEWETIQSLKSSRDELEAKVKARTRILRATNEELKRKIDERDRAKLEREKLVGELQNALTKVKLLSGLLPICSSCKKIRDDKGYWTQIEKYIKEHSEADFSHGLCPECMEKLYPGYNRKPENGGRT